MLPDPNATSLRVTRRFAASPERVFDAWIEPDMARRWLFTTAGGEIVRAELDARVGGAFTIVDRRDGDTGREDIEHVGEYLEMDRPRRLAFTFSVPRYSPHVSRVTVDIVPLGAGCELTLTQADVLPEWASQTKEGWTTLLGQLAHALGEAPAAASARA
jgi:uncharacterized protein YndB with AHSA1/START domain